MNKKILLLSLAIVAAAACFIFFKSKNKTTDSRLLTEQLYVSLLPRKASLAYPAEWATLKNNADVLLQKIKKKPSDLKSQVLIDWYLYPGRTQYRQFHLL